MFSEHNPFNEHGDVLNATPTDADSKARLVEEIKSRARGAFATKAYPVAEKLYTKGIEVQPDATLYANRSAVRAGLGFQEGALEDAEEAISMDPAYAKGYWRKGAALLLHGAARAADAAAAFQQGQQLEPSNAAWAAQIAKAKALAATAGGSGGPAKPAGSGGSSAAGSRQSSASPAVTKAVSKSAVSKAAVSDGGTAAEAEAEGAGGGAHELRGYRKTADGRTTTYFNRDLSEHEKALIGDIAPKKIDASGGAQGGSPPVGGAGEGASAWNTAGTWEERDATAWCQERITSLLSDLVVDVPPGPIRVAKVSEVKGDASITFSRGKRRCLYEFSIKVDWEARWQCGPAKGTLHYPDMSYDCMGEYEATTTVDPLTAPAARPLIEQFVRAEHAGLRKAVQERLTQFVQEFNQKQ